DACRLAETALAVDGDVVRRDDAVPGTARLRPGHWGLMPARAIRSFHIWMSVRMVCVNISGGPFPATLLSGSMRAAADCDFMMALSSALRRATTSVGMPFGPASACQNLVLNLG